MSPMGRTLIAGFDMQRKQYGAYSWCLQMTAASIAALTAAAAGNASGFSTAVNGGFE